ncbi:MAG: putative diguanylate cyclase/phosphodiesterase with sensor [Solirubrobacterales bacterium]|nr:putative diguanylate cyclase/phosphodiesterase with sensor [Solirubrobacterales bacterium]
MTDLPAGDGRPAPPGDPATLLAENRRLRSALHRHRRLLSGVSRLQHLLATRVPLQRVLDEVVEIAEDITGDPLPALYLLDPDDEATLVLRAHRGISGELADQLRRRPVGVGVSGHAVAEDRLVVAAPYAAFAGALPAFLSEELTAAMAAPIHEDGRPIGALVVASHAPDRRYTAGEQEVLTLLADHVSAALNDARIAAAMSRLALHDALTGLPNRTLLLNRLEHAVDRRTRDPDGPGVAVLFCDLDDFKTVNDSLGHPAGDELLRIAAERLRQCVRPGDTAARLGGDEFAVLLEDVRRPQDATLVAERVLAALRSPMIVQGREVFASASIGIAMEADSEGDLLRAADVAMYTAKAAGRGRFALYRPSMQADAVARLELEADLQRALDRDELEVYYQPLVHLASAQLVGFEALVRWHHPERGLVLPATFIALAEETGRIGQVDRLVLRQACRQFAHWRAAFPFAGLDTICVNISGRQLSAPGLDADVLGALHAAGLDPAHLMLELTETTLMQDIDVAAAALAAVKALGVRVAIDDFGTGYSSLRYLHTFPLDALKMAKAFVDGLADGLRDDALATAIVDLAGNLGLGVVAEGIEEQGQLERLRELGCDLGQGWLFGPALRGPEVAALLASPPPDALWRLGPPPAAEDPATVDRPGLTAA